MSRTFAYTRVSTLDQTPENQIREIEAAGFTIQSHRIVAETISGSMAIAQRKGFSKLLDKMEQGGRSDRHQARSTWSRRH